MSVVCPKCGYEVVADIPREMDARTVPWQVRVRLYRHSSDDPEADSDPEAAADAAGQEVIRGLPGVAEHVAKLAENYHGACAVTGLDMQTLRHRLNSLRPTLSRRGGNAVWRVPYQVQAHLIGGGSQPADWLARVDIQRVT